MNSFPLIVTFYIVIFIACLMPYSDLFSFVYFIIDVIFNHFSSHILLLFGLVLVSKSCLFS